MPSDRRRNCQVCGRHENEVGPISWRGKCGVCGPAVFNAANDDLHYHRGPTFALWRRRMAECVGGLLLDDLLPPE